MAYKQKSSVAFHAHFLNVRTPQASWSLIGPQDVNARLCSFSIFIDQLSTRTSHLILLPISLRPTRTPHSISSLLRTVKTQRSSNKGVSPVLTTIIRLRTFSLIASNNSSLSDDSGQGDLMIPFQLRPFTSLLTRSQSTEF